MTSPKLPKPEDLDKARAVASAIGEKGREELAAAERALRQWVMHGDPTLADTEAYDTLARALERLNGIVAMASQKHQAELDAQKASKSRGANPLTSAGDSIPEAKR